MQRLKFSGGLVNGSKKNNRNAWIGNSPRQNINLPDYDCGKRWREFGV